MIQLRLLCRVIRSWMTWSANVAFYFGKKGRMSGKTQGASRHSPSSVATTYADWQMERFTPTFCIAATMFSVPLSKPVSLRPASRQARRSRHPVQQLPPRPGLDRRCHPGRWKAWDAV